MRVTECMLLYVTVRRQCRQAGLRDVPVFKWGQSLGINHALQGGRKESQRRRERRQCQKACQRNAS